MRLSLQVTVQWECPLDLSGCGRRSVVVCSPWCGVISAAMIAMLTRAHLLRRQRGGQGLSGGQPRAAGLHAGVQAGDGSHDGAPREGCAAGHYPHGGMGAGPEHTPNLTLNLTLTQTNLFLQPILALNSDQPWCFIATA